MTTLPEIRENKPGDFTDEQTVEINRFSNRMRAERLPKEPPHPVEHTRGQLRNIPPVVDVTAFSAWDGDMLVAQGSAVVLRMEENKHLAQTEIEVLPEWRRRGLGSVLLRRIADVARAENRSLLLFSTYASVPAGEAFMQRLGAQPGLAQHINELELAEVDRDLLQRWQQQATERAADLEIGLWVGPYPEEHLDGVAEMMEAANTIPTGDLDVEDFHFTPDHLRQMDQSLLGRGFERWTLYVRDLENGKFAGWTEVVWDPHQPELLEQGGTVVLPEYRNRGLGRWLKAAMLEKVLRERPQVKRIHTGNADMNEAMLSINTKLGFKPYVSTTLWQAPLEKVQEYLDARKDPVPAGA